jgi:rhodanese-related sulfurtransferase
MTYTNAPVDDHREVVGSAGQLIDVREPVEFAEGTLPGAINIPLGELPDRLAELDQNRRVVLLCRSGGRSANAAQFLATSGFEDVVNLEGGLLAHNPTNQSKGIRQ